MLWRNNRLWVGCSVLWILPVNIQMSNANFPFTAAKHPDHHVVKKGKPWKACNTVQHLFHLQHLITNMPVEFDWESLSILPQTIRFRVVIWWISLREGKCYSFIFHSFTIIYSKSKVAVKNRRSLLYCVTIGKKLRNVFFLLTLTDSLQEYEKIK